MNIPETLHDSSPMPFGKYMGQRLIDVPAVYLLWLHDQGCSHEGLRKYLIDNLDVIKTEASRAKASRR